jgi:K+-sensing histidine kinase KdpD
MSEAKSGIQGQIPDESRVGESIYGRVSAFLSKQGGKLFLSHARLELHPVFGYAVAIALVAAAAAISEVWVNFFSHHRNLGMPFLIAVVLTGAWGGTRPALLAAALSFGIYRYFLTEPFYQLTFDESDALSLVTFLAAATLTGAMAGRLSDRARSAADRLRRLTVLFEASRDLSAAANRVEVARRLVARLESDAGLRVSVFAREDDSQLLLARAPRRGFAAPSEASEDGALSCEHIALRTARGEIGTVDIPWSDRPMNAADRQWIEALIQLGAIALDRATLATEISDARLVAEREGLRTALLSSLSHDLRTPIATILASASSLAENPDKFDEATKRELLETIQTQADRLNRYVSNLLDMTRLETGALVLKRDFVAPAECLSSAIENLRPRLQSHRIVRSFETTGPSILVDPILLEQALVNILDNAAKFSPVGSRIEVGAQTEGGDVVMWVEDEGPGVTREEIPRIFDKFFRGNPDGGKHAGVGLGLAVVRGVIEAFGGTVSVQSPAFEGRGARFSIRLPAHSFPEAVW